MTKHVKVVERWEEGEPTPVPSDVVIWPSTGGELNSPFETWVVYVDYHAMTRAQLSETDFSALIAPGSIASDYVGLFGHETG